MPEEAPFRQDGDLLMNTMCMSGEWYVHAEQNCDDGSDVVWTSVRVGSQTEEGAASICPPTSSFTSTFSSSSSAFPANLLDILLDLKTCDEKISSDKWTIQSFPFENYKQSKW